MLKNFEYSMLPFGFVHCSCNNCRKADQCLRSLTLSYVPDTEVMVKMINPHLAVPDGKCPYYLSSKTKKFAYGISHLFDELPFGKVKSVREELINHYGHTNYYRLKRKERSFPPAEQDYVKSVLQRYGVKGSPAFDEYREEYDWEGR